MMLRRTILPICLLLGACVPSLNRETATRAAFQVDATDTLPPMKTFSAPRPSRPVQSNADIARDFLDLVFRMESGRDLPVLTRFEGPIRVRVTGQPPAHLGLDLGRLLHRLRTEAGIDIAMAPNGAFPAGASQITIQAIPRAEIRRALPQAACFVVPNITDISQYARARRSARTDWGRLDRRTQIAVFLPSDAAPQEVRDCLHEELAQALGPLNDLYRLPDSVYNDDNVHTVLTGYDMLILRAIYAPELRSGMTRAQVAERLPAVLARLNPAGQAMAPRRLADTPRSWIDAIQTALGPGVDPMNRRAAAAEAIRIARTMGWQDHRRGFSYYAMGRLLQATDPALSEAQFLEANRFFAASPDMALHRAYVGSQLAGFAVARGQGEAALALLAPHLDIAAQHENAALLATLMLLRAEALDLTGRSAEAQTVRLDSLGWARYGFGTDWAVRAKQREIAQLSPLRGRN